MICIPIIGRTQAEALAKIEISARLADMIELRMDLIREGILGELVGKSRSFSPPLKVLVTNRKSPPAGGQLLNNDDAAGQGRRKRGGKACAQAEIRRIAVLIEAARLECEFVDIELETSGIMRKQLMSAIVNHHGRTKLIISHHDFKLTPSLENMKAILRDCYAAGADIAKIVTYAQHPEDNLRILNLIIYAQKKSRDIIAFCMGQQGVPSRIVAPFFGSAIAFAALGPGSESAPGQLSAAEMGRIFKILEKKAASHRE